MKQSIYSGKHISTEGPRFSLIIPFSPVMANPKLLFNLLKSAGDKGEIEISSKYSKEHAFHLIEGLRDVIMGIKKVPYNKTLAIFISRFTKNFYYFTPTKILAMPSLKYSPII